MGRCAIVGNGSFAVVIYNTLANDMEVVHEFVIIKTRCHRVQTVHARIAQSDTVNHIVRIFIHITRSNNVRCNLYASSQNELGSVG